MTQTPLYTISTGYDRIQRVWTHLNVNVGDYVQLEHMQPGTMFITDDGEAAALAHKFRKTAEVRIESTQEVIKVPLHIGGTVTGYLRWKAGLPQPGDFVEPRDGSFAGQIGVVISPGQTATHVVFPGEEDKIKFNAKSLMIVKAKIVRV